MKDNLIFCCASMEKYAADNSVAIEYTSRFREYSIDIHGSETACIQIYYCPWCGKKLLDSLREQCAEEIFQLGYDGIFDEALPEEYMSDKWWKKQGL